MVTSALPPDHVPVHDPKETGKVLVEQCIDLDRPLRSHRDKIRGFSHPLRKAPAQDIPQRRVLWIGHE